MEQLYIVIPVLLITILLLILWISFYPKIQKYKNKVNKLNSINYEYEKLRSVRLGVVYHYFWSIDNREWKQASIHEQKVLNIDDRLKALKDEYNNVSHESISTNRA